MPNLMLLTNEGLLEAVIEREVGISKALIQTTQIALEVDESQVAFMIIPFHSHSFYAPPVQIIGLASASPERLERLQDWRASLNNAWCSHFVKGPQRDEQAWENWAQWTQIWTMMPPGAFMVARFIG